MALVIEEFNADHLDSTILLLGDAFATNPLHETAFGPEQLDQNRLFFRIVLESLFTGDAFIAIMNGEVKGYMHFAASPSCLPAPEQIRDSADTLLQPLGDAVPLIVEWLSRWCRLDPAEPHIHLGPIGVAPEAQRKGIGKALMRCYVDHLERERAAGYLETDRRENVEFYKKFGFVIRHEEQLIGAPTWYMWRPAAE